MMQYCNYSVGLGYIIFVIPLCHGIIFFPGVYKHPKKGQGQVDRLWDLFWYLS